MNMEKNDLPMGAIVGSNDTIFHQPQWKVLLHNWSL
jgi:hypothetical protein